jgi:hypothetical protein
MLKTSPDAKPRRYCDGLIDWIARKLMEVLHINTKELTNFIIVHGCKKETLNHMAFEETTKLTVFDIYQVVMVNLLTYLHMQVKAAPFHQQLRSSSVFPKANQPYHP